MLSHIEDVIELEIIIGNVTNTLMYVTLLTRLLGQSLGFPKLLKESTSVRLYSFNNRKKELDYDLTY